MTDTIRKEILLRASRGRVWRALSDSAEFGHWFGMKFESPFTAGATVRGTIQPTTVDPDVGKAQESHRGIAFELFIERIEPQRLFAFRWHPGAVEPGIDYSKEPTTLVTFELADAAEGVLLTVTESGFDSIPLERRARAFSANEQGWGMMVKVIARYVEQTS